MKESTKHIIYAVLILLIVVGGTVISHYNGGKNYNEPSPNYPSHTFGFE